MKFAKKTMSFILCLMILATSMINDGWSSLLQESKVAAMSGYEQKYDDTRLEFDFNKGWSFSLIDDDAAYLKGYDDSSWETVDLPHDFSINQDFSTTGTEAESGKLPGGTGWYRKWFNLYEYYSGDHIFLNFDGAYQHTYVYINGEYIGENHYGYNSFSFEISKYLICSNTSKNLIAVKVVNDIPNSRWYTGSGINRDVTLTIAGPVHFTLYGPRLTTPELENGSGRVDALISIHNDTGISKKVTVEATVLDDDHNVVSQTVVSDLLTVGPQQKYELTLSPTVNSPQLWSLDNPNLYKLKTVIKDESGELIDEYHTTFGFRYIEWDAEKGFSLNGEYMKLKGVSLHNDQGALGSAQEYEALYRQLITLKEMGCNAIRTTHNTSSKILIDLCNQLGFLVMEEFFDGWDASKNFNEHDFSEYFHETLDESNTLIGANGQKWYEFVIEQTILRDEHDPCIIAWDIGNELGNITAGESTENYDEISTNIVNLVKSLDSSRVVLHGNNRPYDAVTTSIDNKMDVIGGNYAPDSWAYVMNDGSDSRSSMPFVATEAASAITSRGVYDTMTQYDYQCTSYDTHAVSWGNTATEAWYYVAVNDWFSGEFVWTGFDYIGEPTPWDDYNNENLVPNSSYFGLVDTAGFEKDSYYLYRSWWNEDSTTLHLVPGSWNREKLAVDANGYVNVAVYSNAKKVELLLNGNVIATAQSTDVTTAGGYTYKTWTESISDYSNCSVGSFYTGNGADFYPQFSVKYAEGELSVKAYDENNNEITDTVGSTKSVSGEATQIAVTTWKNQDTFVADGADYIYVEFEARDADGNFINDYNGTLNVKVDDTSARYAKIVGVDNGNPATTEKFQQSSVLTLDSQAVIEMFNGRALVVLRTTEEEGTINLTAIATDDNSTFSTQGVTVTSVTETGIDLTDEFDEVVVQNPNPYQLTLYDEFEVAKYYVNSLQKPQGGGTTPPEEEEPVSEKYEIILADPNNGNGCIPNGKYVVLSNSETPVVMTGTTYDGWALSTDYNLTEAERASGVDYTFQKFMVPEAYELQFTHIGNNQYYIKNKEGEYLNFIKSTWGLIYSDEPQPITVMPQANGSIQLYYEPNGLYIDGRYWNCFYVFDSPNGAPATWLYSMPGSSTPEEPSTPPAIDENAPYQVYFANTSGSGPAIESGDYVLNVGNIVMTNTMYDGWAISTSTALQDIEYAQASASYKYESFNTADSNVFTFTHVEGDKYIIQKKLPNDESGPYLSRNNYMLVYGSEPHLFTVKANADGTVTICSDDPYPTYYVSCTWGPFEFKSDSSTPIQLYSKPKLEESSEKLNLYNALHAAINEDTTSYTRSSFEVLLQAIEDGISVFNDPNSNDDDYIAATQAIRDAIAGLTMDVKKINGTLFKYGYNNENGTQDYSSGGILMNQITVSQMKAAIYADENLLQQIKDTIGYDNQAKWGEGYADKVLDEVVGIYAKIYSLQFTGVPYNGSTNYNAASNYPTLDEYSSWIQSTLWNVWTKDNTHGAEDPVLSGMPVHDGASVQGLASSTLEDGVIKSHAAYDIPLSYANDGPDGENYDVTGYTYSFETGLGYETVDLEYLEGISVYFPDVFTRESLDINGNATTATTGNFAKYYWDAEFPMFISTDEYGVNTYHFDSKDTQYIVQAEFNDEEHKVNMNLKDVGEWSAVGPHSGSGFFPFNYQEGTTNYMGENAIYHYGFTFEQNFYIPKGGKHANGEDVVFNFSGDDDVYVYIDGVLVLDNGGLHGARGVSINFTNCTINYQYAMDVTDAQLKGGEYECTYSYSKLVENAPEAQGYSADTIAALNKLHQVITDGQVHKLNFFYLERGASDSNCRISFNLAETSEEVKIIDQTLTLDYALPVEYNIHNNNRLSQAALDNGVKVEYLGLCAVNEEVDSTYTFELPEIIVPFEEGVTYTIDDMKYGICTINKDGSTSYTPTTMNMTESEHFYVCAKITGDPTYAKDVVYYQIERTTFVPATTIYFEDTFDTITYTNGKVATNYNNTNNFGIWKTDGTQQTTLKQTADIIDSEANPYGYETNYISFAEYSGGSIHSVDVSTRNNPSSKYSGGSGAAWPTAEFTFTGTGFDLISITDNTSGAMNVKVRDANNMVVKSTVVDTFYGYNYGRIYSDNDGNPTLDDSFTPMYRAENGTCTSKVTYYDVNGEITDVAHYYDENGEVVEEQTDNPAYAYAYGWVIAEPGTTQTLYQIPVIKITGLTYGQYTVTITPTFTSSFGHASTAADGSKYYGVYLDAIRIYSPGGEGDDIADPMIKNAYTVDDELYPDYLEVKDMLIGADSLSEKDTQGIIFIDGIAALDNDIETYKKAGPNNELYLAKDQAVAFEIWATAVPTDIQLGVKLAQGNPRFTVSYGTKITDIDIKTATDLYYSFNTIMPNDDKLTWKQVNGSDGEKYYTTGTVVIQNTGDEDSILSITNMKWTFSQYGGKGYFRIPTTVDDEVVTFKTTRSTQNAAYSLLRMRTADLDVTQTQEPEIIRYSPGNTDIVLKVSTSEDVGSLIITDKNGNIIDPEDLEIIASEPDGENNIEWTITVKTDKYGVLSYLISGAYENGYTTDSKTVNITVIVENYPTENNPSEKQTAYITEMLNRLLSILNILISVLGITN